jgi:hypothetical protein
MRSDSKWLMLALSALLVAPAIAQVTVSPPAITLTSPEASQQLLVTEKTAAGQSDLTRKVKYVVAPPEIVMVDAHGLVQAKAEGTTTLTITTASGELKVPVTVSGLLQPKPVSFELEVQPILTKARCNSGGCHGKAEGQNGFKLSLLGFDHDADYNAVVKEGRGRRISLAAPTTSLLLRKASAELPHGGGLKIEAGSPQYRRVLRWIASGAPADAPDKSPVVGIEVEPADVVLQPKESQQLRVSAINAAGQRQCVTVETEFISNMGMIIEASPRGLLQAGEITGEAAILVRYGGHVTVCRVVVPRAGQNIVRPPENNFIDKFVWDKLQKLGIPPSDVTADSAFMRRAFLDTIGTLPTAAEAKAFLADTSPDKRAKLVDALLNRPEYADYWAMKWSDILRADKIKITPQGTVGLTRWLHKQFEQNRPYDEMAREIVTAQGPVQSESPAAFYKAVEQPAVASRAISQLLLGVRIECAQCHHHPSERWSQDDYAAFGSFFTGVSMKALPDGTSAIVSRGGTDMVHPRTNLPVAARPLGGKEVSFTGINDRRQVLATWMTAPDNPYFSKAIANRLWAHYFGRGIVEPIDDIRITNPPTNEPLLDALAARMREVKYDLKAFTKTLLLSRAYQLSSAAAVGNEDDRQYFSHARSKALPAEVLLDALSQATGTPEKFNGWPLGTRSINVWDNRMPSYFFRIFGRPVRATVCECERSNEPSISQALHLLNSPEMNDKITSRSGLARRLATSPASDDEIIAEIYLGTLSRPPTAEELALMKQAFTSSEITRQQAVEDVLWSVLNTKEFLYNN